MNNYIAQNLVYLRKEKGINQSQIADIVGKKYNTIGYWEKGSGEPTISDVMNICQYFDIPVVDFYSKDLSNTHLIEKREQKNNDTNTHPNTHPSTHLISEKEGLSGVLAEANEGFAPYEKAKKGIPLVEETAIAGFGNGNFSLADQDIKEQYVIPLLNHKKVDFMIKVEGSSMYPKYSAGDVLACTIISESSFIQWNKTHVVATQHQGILVKRIKKGNTDLSLLMVSDNPSYDPFEVPKDEITGIAMVVGVIRLE